MVHTTVSTFNLYLIASLFYWLNKQSNSNCIAVDGWGMWLVFEYFFGRNMCLDGYFVEAELMQNSPLNSKMNFRWNFLLTFEHYTLTAIDKHQNDFMIWGRGCPRQSKYYFDDLLPLIYYIKWIINGFN